MRETTAGSGPLWWAVNTDLKHGAVSAPEEWVARGIAVVSDRRWQGRFDKVLPGHMVFMWVSGRGLSAIGRVTGSMQQVTDPHRMMNPSEAIEFHRSVDWCVDMRENPLQLGALRALGLTFESLPNQAIREAVHSPGLIQFAIERLSAPAASSTECNMRVRALRAIGASGTSPLVRPGGFHKPVPAMRTAAVYPRCPRVREWTLRRASGLCECCGRPAPFVDLDETPFLESHHLVWLSQDGDDVPENTVAVCPNCHRELHHGVRRSDLQRRLLEAIPRKDLEFQRAMVPAAPDRVEFPSRRG